MADPLQAAGMKNIRIGTTNIYAGNAAWLTGVLTDAQYADALRLISAGGDSFRTGIKQLAAGTGLISVDQAVSLGFMGAALVKGDMRTATEQAWAYNFGVAGSVMVGAVREFLLGPPGAVGGAMISGWGFGKLGEGFGGAYYDVFGR